MDEEKHIKELANLCRVCGGPVKQNRLCKDHEVALKSVFSIDISTDKPNVHPQSFASVAMLWYHGQAKQKLKEESISMV